MNTSSSSSCPCDSWEIQRSEFTDPSSHDPETSRASLYMTVTVVVPHPEKRVLILPWKTSSHGLCPDEPIPHLAIPFAVRPSKVIRGVPGNKTPARVDVDLPSIINMASAHVHTDNVS